MSKGTTVRPLRVEDNLWERFQAAVKALGFPDRSAALRAYMAEVVAEHERTKEQH